ncbi:MAG: tyrosine-type recombinase/integrase, partial [Pseudomonadota bacterium]|nr:tyrosine-type recombinase/integrase [Pseudomonadota bacterium]
IKQYIGWMYDKKYSYSHLVNTSLGLEHYTRYKGQVVKLTRPKKPRRLIKDVLTESEVSRLLLAAKNIRTKAMICLLSYSGARNNELCNIKVQDVDLGGNQLTIRDGKNRQDGVINISAECTRVLIDYLRDYPREKEEFLFTTLVRKKQLTTGDLRKTLRIMALKANIGRRVFPHLLRHSLATNLLNRGASLMMIQQQLRHRFIESTMIYVFSRPVRNRSEYDFHKPAYM